MRIVITGTPGTGKTKIAKELAKRTGIRLVNIKEFVNRNHIFKIEKGQKVVDVGLLGKKLLSRIKKSKEYIVEGHLACEIKIPADFVFVLRANPNKLRARLAKRKYKREKLEENLEAEMLDYCVQRVEAVYGKTPLELDTSQRTVTNCVNEILAAIRKRKKVLDQVDFSRELKNYLKLKE